MSRPSVFNEVRFRAREREKAKEWIANLPPGDFWELGDQLVLGEFDWRDWGFNSKPSAVFMNAIDEERINREIMGGP